MATCTFASIDSATQGSWAGVYGSEGYNVANDSSSYPAYATVTISGQSVFNWGGLAGISPYQASSPTTPNPYIWYGTQIDVDVALTSGDHGLAFYFYQNDGNSRTITVQVLDMDSGGTLLDTQTVGGGSTLQTAPVYVVWRCSGHVKVRVTVSGLNAILGAFFFDPPPTIPPAPTGAIEDTQDVIEYAAQYAATIYNTQEAIEYAAQYQATIYDTQEIIEVIWRPVINSYAYAFQGIPGMALSP